MKNKQHLYRLIYKTLPALLSLFIFYIAVMPETAIALASNSSVSTVETDNQDDFDKKFREGRDLIDREEWARAAERFREAIEKYPGGKSADAALYWLAFCHKKQKQFKEADAALDRLLEKFPASTWVSDARVMKLEIAAPLGRIYSGSVGATTLYGVASAGSTATASPLYKVAGAGAASPGFYETLKIGGVSTTGARTALDREDEIKIAAFQSLLAADQKRAIETMGEILKPDSKASEILKQEVLRVLRRLRTFSDGTMLFAVGGSGRIAKEFTTLLRDTLVKSFQNETNLKIRKEIVFALANTGDEAAEQLKKLYAAENDREVKQTIINAFGSSGNSFYNFTVTGAPNRKIEADFLLETLRTEKDSELRASAFTNLQRIQNWSANQETIDLLANLYDSETDEAFKISIIRAFAVAKQNQAIRKLLNIAKNDKSDKLRLEAIYSLRNSKEPEVLKFLEDLIK